MSKVSENTYRVITVRDIVNAVNSDKKTFPKGLDTPIGSGDFECNCTHYLHEIQNDKMGKHGRGLILSYEMHENCGG